MSRGQYAKFLSDGVATDVSEDAPLPIRQYDGAGNPISFGFTAQQITTTTTTNIKVGAGMCGGIQCVKAGSGDTVTVYDAASATGTPIATGVGLTVDSPPMLAGANFGVGLTIVTSGGTPGNYVVLVA